MSEQPPAPVRAVDQNGRPGQWIWQDSRWVWQLDQPSFWNSTPGILSALALAGVFAFVVWVLYGLA